MVHNHLRSSSNTRNQAVIHDGRMDIQSKNSIEEYDHNVQRNPRIASTLGKINVQCYNCNEKGHYARECPKPRVCDAKYFKEQMLLALKEEAGCDTP
ncbi:integrase, catalytic region, zinc finger, CCHC-type containing protein [Tanacetum coccineum]